jgi:uncharacterized membrane protein (UPF0127 family)
MIARALLLAMAAPLLLAAACDGGDGGATPAPQPTAPSGLETVTLTFINGDGKEVELLAEIADEPQERSRGLMFRESLDENAGMIFVFGGETNAGFWMENTTIPLSIAFIDAGGTIVDIHDMQPLDRTLTHSSEPYYYAVEVNQSWYERNNIFVGDRMEVPEEVRE